MLDNQYKEAEAVIAEFQEDFNKLRAEIGKGFIGNDALVQDLLDCILAGGHILLEGVPGTGKTVLAKTIASSMGLSYQRIQCTPDLMPTDVTGHYGLEEDSRGSHKIIFKPGPVMANYILVDEINRATPKTQSALLEAMQEGQVTVARESIKLPQPNIFIATQNPVEHEGTYNLPEAQLDRFMVKLKVGYPGLNDYKTVLLNTTGEKSASIECVCSVDRVLEMRELVKKVEVADSVLEYAVRSAILSDPQSSALAAVKDFVVLGVSPRGVQALIMMGKVKALCDGRTAVSCKDLVEVIPVVYRHRILLAFSARNSKVVPEDIIESIISELNK